MRVKFAPLHDARCGTAVGDGVRPTARELTDRADAVRPVHLDDAFGRSVGWHQHAREMDADMLWDGSWIPRLDDGVNARHRNADPHFLRFRHPSLRAPYLKVADRSDCRVNVDLLWQQRFLSLLQRLLRRDIERIPELS